MLEGSRAEALVGSVVHDSGRSPLTTSAELLQRLLKVRQLLEATAELGGAWVVLLEVQ